MYIAPNSTIHVLKGVPLDNTYRDTILFGTAGEQRAYFVGKNKYTVAQYTYQRKERKLRIGITADNLYDCNYLMFQNTAFGNKWFYAFIIDVEYVNNEASDVTFEIDVMQTWHFDYNLRMSYVEREHSTTDEIGANLVPENLEFGDYMYKDLGLTSLFDLPQIVVAATFDKDLNDAVGGLYGGVYSGLCYNVFTTYSDVNSFLERVTTENKSDGIVAIYMLPIAFTADYQTTIPEAFELERDKPYNNIDGYVPKCKKLFTYPYQMLYVTNNEGGAANYPFEYFATEKCQFKVSGVMCCTPEVMLVPEYFKNVNLNYNEKLVIGNFPQCAYSIDSFKAFIAQNAFRLTANMGIGLITTGAAAATAYATGGLVGTGAAISGLTSIANDLATIGDKSTLPPQAKGSQSSFINFANEIKGFQFFYAYIRREFAEIIDNYFNMFGYATHKVKIPNRNARPHWTYLKTRGVVAVGSVPVDDMAKIKANYDRGITFWNNGNEIGFYSLDNSPYPNARKEK